MKIAYLINQYPKVSHSFIRREIIELEKQGVPIIRIAMRGWESDAVDPVDVIEGTKTQYILKAPKFSFIKNVLKVILTNPIGFFRAFIQMLKIARFSDKLFLYNFIYLIEACSLVNFSKKHEVTHIHSHFGTNATEIVLYSKILGGPTYSFTVHGPEEFDKPINLALSDKIANSKFVVAITHFCASQLYRWCDYSLWGKIKIVGCGLDDKFINDLPVPSVDKTNNTLVCVGRLCEQKGQLFLIDAVHAVLSQGYDMHLILAGDGEMRDVIEQRIKYYGIGNKVTITGWISSDQVKDYLLQSRAMILPSFAEGLPVVIMEAMALHRPVITTSIAGVPELVKHLDSGWLFPAGDSHSLSKAIIDCLQSDPIALSVMGNNAAAAVKSSHSIEIEAAKLKHHFSD